jgi:ATP-dependent helicase/nuclease subunit A
MERGELLHRLMAALAPLPPDQRGEAGRRLLAVATDWPAEAREALLAESLAVLALPALAALFGPGSLAEVALIGEVEGGVAVNGRIDRLLVSPDRVVLADFKTDRHVPQDAADLPPAHVRQVGLYARLLRKLYPAKEIGALLVYTAGPCVHALDADALERAVDDVTAR